MASWGRKTLPNNLKDRKHDDWPGFYITVKGKKIPIGLNAIPRAWTSFNFGPPKVRYSFGLVFLKDSEKVWWTLHEPFKPCWVDSWEAPKPITSPNSFQLSYYPYAPWWAWPINWYVAYSFPRNKMNKKFRQFRLGARWDNVDMHPGAPMGYVNFPTFPTLRKYTGDDFQDTQDW